MSIINRLFGEWYCCDCKKRFDKFSKKSAIRRCPYCESNNWCTYSTFIEFIERNK